MNLPVGGLNLRCPASRDSQIKTSSLTSLQCQDKGTPRPRRGLALCPARRHQMPFETDRQQIQPPV